jgi:AcrR family transcriptional regulator
MTRASADSVPAHEPASVSPDKAEFGKSIKINGMKLLRICHGSCTFRVYLQADRAAQDRQLGFKSLVSKDADMRQAVGSSRRNPAQARARQTVAIFFEAAARILESGKPQHLTTNHIAARAGFSIGTLYGYFPNKEALLRAMGVQEIARQEALTAEALQRAPLTNSGETSARILIRAALWPFAGRPRLRKAMLSLLARDEAVMKAPLEMLPRLSQNFASLGATSAVSAFTLPRAIIGAIRAAIIERPELLDSQAFEDELVAMAMHALQPDLRGAAAVVHL